MREGPTKAAALGMPASVAGPAAAQDRAPGAAGGTVALLRGVRLPYFELDGDGDAVAERAKAAGFTIDAEVLADLELWRGRH